MMKAKSSLAGFTLIELLLVIVILGILITVALNVINPGRIQRRSQEAVHLSNSSKACTALAACASASYIPSDCNTPQKVGIQTIHPPLGGITPTYTYTVEGNTVVMLGSLYATASSKNSSGAITDPTRMCAISCVYDFNNGVATPPTKNPTVTISGTTTVYSGCY
jgi:prepilin-type N-terminal cleavage/methylation domain-containing protein